MTDRIGEAIRRLIDLAEGESRIAAVCDAYGTDPTWRETFDAARADLRALRDAALVLRWENTGEPHGIQFVLEFGGDGPGPARWTVQDNSPEHRVFSRGVFVNGLPVLDAAARRALGEGT